MGAAVYKVLEIDRKVEVYKSISVHGEVIYYIDDSQKSSCRAIFVVRCCCRGGRGWRRQDDDALALRRLWFTHMRQSIIDVSRKVLHIDLSS